ncbi:retron system putative HNH endonuclease [Haliangium sp.]|uniref:retron system putative HNH endonuclease n=1 Tax=Haliangium sp. TaxID=2663208 RepID=UPI003D14EF67
MSASFRKRREPKELRAWKRQSEPLTDKGWNELEQDAKRAVRTRLHRDQGGLCCYCYVRIGDDSTSHIEHVAPQSEHNRFDWENLALACEGGNDSGAPAHCDHAKDQTALEVVHPYKAPVSRYVRLRKGTGALQVKPEATHDVVVVLQLNRKHLQRLRRSALAAALQDLEDDKRRREEWKARPLQQALDDLRQRREPIDYQPLIEAWLEQRLRRAG